MVAEVVHIGSHSRAPQRAFVPQEPSSLVAAGLTDGDVEGLILKYLAARGDASGQRTAEQIRLPLHLVTNSLDRLKAAHLIAYRSSVGYSDFEYRITDQGRDTAERLAARCTYFGSAPVSLQDYVASVTAQGTSDRTPGPRELAYAFDGLIIDQSLMERLGPAIASGRGMFLFGPSGNGKTSIATRITRSLGGLIWIPRAIGIDGEIIRVFDPQHHVEVPPTADELDSALHMLDRRWVRIERPTVTVGGELTPGQLEVTLNPHTGISEAPLQLKANGGTLVIDDFGRQRMSTDELLNRWIVPLESNYDFYSLSSGRRVTMPFMQVIVFSTNLEPKELVDEAFLRRIPYKVPVPDPTHAQFRELLGRAGAELGVSLDSHAVDHLIDRHYRAARRQMRFCHPRDLLLQIRNESIFLSIPARMTVDSIDRAVDNYFSII